MPSATEKIERLREETPDGEIPYFSKSRIKSWETCPRKFYHTYILGKRGEETFAMKQGTRIHEVFEDYYANVVQHYKPKEGQEIPPFPPDPDYLVQFLPDDTLRWADWMEFMSNFLVWECERAKNSLKNNDSIERAIVSWLPVGIEEEAWESQTDGPPRMGFADVIVNSSSVKEVESNDGVVIVDFKTGKTPKKKYRNKGIFLEGEYYGMIFDDLYDVVGVAGFYPKAGDFIVSDLSKKRRDHVNEIIESINEAIDCEGMPPEENFPIDEQPLCMWGTGEGESCDFYNECPSKWGIPAENKEVFVGMVENGSNAYQIADYLECEVNVVYYWARKFDLDL